MVHVTTIITKLSKGYTIRQLNYGINVDKIKITKPKNAIRTGKYRVIFQQW